MKISFHKSPGDPNYAARPGTPCIRGIMLIDCLVYIALFFVVLGLAFSVFYTCWDNAKRLRRNADDIISTLKSGERWRADIRGATAPLRAEDSPEGQILRIPHATGEVDYRFSDGSLWRRAGAAGDWTEALSKIKSSRMEADQRPQVTAWRWEVQLDAGKSPAHVIPLFTFEAVPQPGSQP